MAIIDQFIEQIEAIRGKWSVEDGNSTEPEAYGLALQGHVHLRMNGYLEKAKEFVTAAFELSQELDVDSIQKHWWYTNLLQDMEDIKNELRN